MERSYRARLDDPSLLIRRCGFSARCDVDHRTWGVLSCSTDWTYYHASHRHRMASTIRYNGTINHPRHPCLFTKSTVPIIANKMNNSAATLAIVLLHEQCHAIVRSAPASGRALDVQASHGAFHGNPNTDLRQVQTRLPSPAVPLGDLEHALQLGQAVGLWDALQLVQQQPPFQNP